MQGVLSFVWFLVQDFALFCMQWIAQRRVYGGHGQTFYKNKQKIPTSPKTGVFFCYLIKTEKKKY